MAAIDVDLETGYFYEINDDNQVKFDDAWWLEWSYFLADMPDDIRIKWFAKMIYKKTGLMVDYPPEDDPYLKEIGYN